MDGRGSARGGPEARSRMLRAVGQVPPRALKVMLTTHRKVGRLLSRCPGGDLNRSAVPSGSEGEAQGCRCAADARRYPTHSNRQAERSDACAGKR